MIRYLNQRIRVLMKPISTIKKKEKYIIIGMMVLYIIILPSKHTTSNQKEISNTMNQYSIILMQLKGRLWKIGLNTQLSIDNNTFIYKK